MPAIGLDDILFRAPGGNCSGAGVEVRREISVTAGSSEGGNATSFGRRPGEWSHEIVSYAFIRSMWAPRPLSFSSINS